MVAINPPTTEVIQNDYVNPSFEDTTTSPLINSSWGAEGNCSIQIPPGSTYALPELLGGKALQIVPRNAGQNLLRRGELVAKNLATNPSFEAVSPVPAGGVRSDVWAADGSWSLYVPDEGYGMGPFGLTPFGI